MNIPDPQVVVITCSYAIGYIIGQRRGVALYMCKFSDSCAIKLVECPQ